MERNKADRIARLCMNHYAALPKRGKPQTGKEWTLIAGIVMEIGDILNDSHAEVVARRAFIRVLYHHIGLVLRHEFTPIFEPTTTTAASVPSPHNVPTDQTSEPISTHLQSQRSPQSSQASQEIPTSVSSGSLPTTEVDGRVSLKKGVKFHFFTSHTPCGDASIFPKTGETLESHDFDESVAISSSPSGPTKRQLETEGVGILKRAKIDSQDECFSNVDRKSLSVEPGKHVVDDRSASPRLERDIHRTGAKCVPGAEQDALSSGVDYHRLGLLRIKPGRGERTLSMSCSDKMAKWTRLGYQGALLSHFIKEPIVMDSVIVGKCPYSQVAMYRAVFGRWKDFCPRIEAPELTQSQVEFGDAKARVESFNPRCVPSNTSVIWCDVPGEVVQVAVNGRKQGVTKKTLHSPEARCCVCKAELFVLFTKLMEIHAQTQQQLPRTLLQFASSDGIEHVTYRQYKDAATDYQTKWRTLREQLQHQWQSSPKDLEQLTASQISWQS